MVNQNANFNALCRLKGGGGAGGGEEGKRKQKKTNHTFFLNEKLGHLPTSPPSGAHPASGQEAVEPVLTINTDLL